MSNISFKAGIRTAILVILSVLLIDQASKIYIKLNFLMDEEVHVWGDWFILHFTENPGMAFGMEFGGRYGKLLLTSFRIVAVIGLSYYLVKQIRLGINRGFVISLSLITAGAAGNIIDSVFYGVIFSETTHYELASAFSGNGYAPFFYGRVVDMLYLPVFKGYLPEWLGGDYFIFFRPIFNIADASISIGVFIILLFQRSFFKEEKVAESADSEDESGVNFHSEDSNPESSAEQDEKEDDGDNQTDRHI